MKLSHKNSVIDKEIELMLLQDAHSKAYPEISIPIPSAHEPHKYNIKGIAYALAGAFLNVMAGAIKKTIPDVPVPQLLFVRTIYTVILVSAILLVNKQTQELRKSFTVPVILMAIGRTLCNLFYFTSLISLTVSELITIYSTNGMLSGILASVALKEPYTGIEKILGLLCFAGVILIVRPPFLFGQEISPDQVDPELPRYIAGIMGFLAAFFFSASQVTIRSMKIKIPTWILGFHIQVNAFLFFAIYLWLMGGYRPLSYSEHWGVFLSGVCTFAIIHLNIRAIELEKPSVVGVIQYSQLLFSLLFDVLIMGTFPSTSTFIGAAFIFGSCFYLIKLQNSDGK